MILTQLNAILVISARDVIKLFRDRARIITTFIFPFLFIGVLGGSLQANLDPGYNFLVFVFTGVLGQTMFQSTAAGIMSLIEDRANDFSQEIFVSPISRYTIIFGKIVGETTVSFVQFTGIVIFGAVMGIPFTLLQIIQILPAAIAASLLGGAFGVLVLANLKNERTANQLFPLLIFPQFFLAGVFNPIQKLPFYLDLLSRISPMRYAVDLVRGVFYAGQPEYSLVVLASPLTNLLIMSTIFTVFLLAGTYLFVRGERNR